MKKDETNIERVLNHIRQYPGQTQSEISSKLGIKPVQQVNQILHKLIKRELIVRNSQPYQYYASENSALIQIKSSVVKSTEIIENELPGNSKTQREAEEWLILNLSQKLNVNLQKKKIPLSPGYLELDGFSEKPLILCEAWAHVGSVKSAQKNKAMSDALKLIFASSQFSNKGKLILVFGDIQTARHFQGKSWMVQCLNKYKISIEVIEFPIAMREIILLAQKRQYR